MTIVKPWLVDTHAHLTDGELEAQLPAVLARAREAGVGHIVCVGTTADSSRRALALAQLHPTISATVGIHPNYAHQALADDWEAIEALMSQPKVVAIGETGLDRYWDDCPWEIQLANFHRHWQASRQYQLPVVVHSRDCDLEMVAELRRAAEGRSLRGVMHAFSGSLAMAEACLELGLYISFAGMLTYKKSNELRQVAAAIPLQRLLLETDAPYLSPEPKRATRPNEPSLVVHTATCLARCLGIEFEALAQATSQNARRLFGLEIIE